MKIVAISDTHGLHSQMKHELPKGDLLIHAGDLTNVGRKIEVEDILGCFNKVSSHYTYGVVFVAGNHDRSFDPKFNLDSQTEKPIWLQKLLNTLPSNIHYLENSSVNINGINI